MAVDDEREAWLGELLNSAAAEYEPDSERLQAMVAARIDGDEPAASADAGPRPQNLKKTARSKRPTRRVRGRGFGLAARLGIAGIPAGVALVSIGAAAALAVGATATIAVTSNHNSTKTVAVLTPSSPQSASASPSQATAASPSTQPGGTAQATHAATSTSVSTSSAGAPAGNSTATPSGTPESTTSNDLTSVAASIDAGSNSAWAQLDVVVTIRKPLTALDITVKVSDCANLQSTGSWDSGPGNAFTTSIVKASDGSITYEFELIPGQTVYPSTLTFAAQFNHSTTAWAPTADTYFVSARTATSTSASSANGAF